MDDALFVRGFEGLRDLSRDRQRFIDGNCPTRDPLREILTLDKLHYQRVDATAVLKTMNMGDVRMIQCSQRARFALKAREPLGVARERFGQDLDRDEAIELDIARAIHLAH